VIGIISQIETSSEHIEHLMVDAPYLHELDRVDAATAKLILQLRSGDNVELLHASKGKSRDDDLSDADLAIATYQKELQDKTQLSPTSASPEALRKP
jgi:hypothetical protein